MQTAPQVADKAVDGILQRIDALAAKIGTTAQHVWDVYVAQARVEALRDTLAFIAFLLIAGGLVRLAMFAESRASAMKQTRQSCFDDEGMGWMVVTVFAPLASLVFVIISLTYAYNSIGEWVNPQYWAFQHLAQDIRGIL